MARYTDSVRARARQLYEHTDQPIRSIAAELDIGENTLQRMKIKDGWAKRCERVRGLPDAVQLLEEVKALSQTISPLSLPIRHPEARAKRASKGDGPDKLFTEGPHLSRLGEERLAPQNDGSSDAALVEGESGSPVDRLEALVMNAIATEEAGKAQFVGKRRTATVSERSARTLATLTQTLRALRQMRNGALPDTESLNDDSNDRDDMPRDIDEFRRDLARRIDAFVASRTDASDVDGDAGPAPLDAAG